MNPNLFSTSIKQTNKKKINICSIISWVVALHAYLFKIKGVHRPLKFEYPVLNAQEQLHFFHSVNFSSLGHEGQGSPHQVRKTATKAGLTPQIKL